MVPLPELCLGCTGISQLVPDPALTCSEHGWVAETLSSSSSYFPQTLPAPLARDGLSESLVPLGWVPALLASTTLTAMLEVTLLPCHTHVALSHHSYLCSVWVLQVSACKRNSFVFLLHPSTYSLLTAAYSHPQDAACPYRDRCCCSCKSFAETFIISEKYLKDLKTPCVYLQTLLTISSSHPSYSAPAWVRPTDVNSVKPLGEVSSEHVGIFLWQFVLPLSLGKLCFPWTSRSCSSAFQSAPSEVFDHSFLFLLPIFQCSLNTPDAFKPFWG